MEMYMGRKNNYMVGFWVGLHVSRKVFNELMN